LFAKEAEFLRTPKTNDDATLLDAVRGNAGETALAVLGLGGIVAAMTNLNGYAGPLTALLLIWPTIAFASAPVNSLAAQRATLPADLRERRRTEFLRSGRAQQVTAAAGGLVLAGVTAGVIAALLVPGDRDVPPPALIGPATGTPAPDPGDESPTPSPAVPGSSPSPSGPTPSSPSGTVSPGSSTSPSPGDTASPTATPGGSDPAPSPTPTGPAPVSPTPTTTAPAPPSPSSPSPTSGGTSPSPGGTSPTPGGASPTASPTPTSP
jgi:hypothetical protein